MKRDSILGPAITISLVIGAIGIIGYAGNCAGNAYKVKPIIDEQIERVMDYNPELLQKPVDIGYEK